MNGKDARDEEQRHQPYRGGDDGRSPAGPGVIDLSAWSPMNARAVLAVLALPLRSRVSSAGFRAGATPRRGS